MRKLCLVGLVLQVLFCLSACNTSDNTNYFEQSVTEDYSSSDSVVEEKFNEFSAGVSEKIKDFDPYTPNDGLPESVYEYDVKDAFKITEESTEKEKGLQEYWSNMWRSNTEEE